MFIDIKLLVFVCIENIFVLFDLSLRLVTFALEANLELRRIDIYRHTQYLAIFFV